MQNSREPETASIPDRPRIHADIVDIRDILNRHSDRENPHRLQLNGYVPEEEPKDPVLAAKIVERLRPLKESDFWFVLEELREMHRSPPDEFRFVAMLDGYGPDFLGHSYMSGGSERLPGELNYAFRLDGRLLGFCYCSEENGANPRYEFRDTEGVVLEMQPPWYGGQDIMVKRNRIDPGVVVAFSDLVRCLEPFRRREREQAALERQEWMDARDRENRRVQIERDRDLAEQHGVET